MIKLQSVNIFEFINGMIEEKIIDNVANKLEIVLFTKKTTVLSLSKLLTVDKQALYRVVKREHLPNVIFLCNIAKYLDCTLSELIDDRLFMSIKVFKNYDYSNKIYKNYKVFFYEKDIKHLLDKEFFGIFNGNFIEVLYITNIIQNDGNYLICDKEVITKIEIISVGTNLIIALDANKKEIRLNPKDIRVVAKFYRTVFVQQLKEYAIEI